MCVPGVIVLLLGTSFYLVESCPSSCAVCSEETTVCQGLPYIIALPSRTKVLIITEGDLSSIGINHFSHLLDLTLLSLSGNKIKKIQSGAFSNLTKLQTLILNHNQISSTSITSRTFFPLRNLKTLQLNSNFFSSIDGTWFGNTERLIRLDINRNHITNLTRDSLGFAALHQLQHLDLSNNLISFIHKGTFQSLQQLKELDLSRNRLTKLSDVFSFLPHLTLLNLGHNYWNCSCDLHHLADFLRNYTYSTERILKNRKGLRCSYSSNPAVISLLQLTDRNCGFKSYNITVNTREKNRGSTRDGLLISILVITGIIALFLLIILIVKSTLKPNKSHEQSPTRCSCGEVHQLPIIQRSIHKVGVTHKDRSDVMFCGNSPRNGKGFLKKHVGSLHPGCNVQESGKCLRCGGTGRLPGTYYICFHCRLVQWRPPSPAAMFDTNEEGCISNSIQRIPDNPKDFVLAAPWEGANTTVLQELSRLNKGEKSVRRSFFPKDDMTRIKSDNIPKANLCNNLSEKSHRNMDPYKQSADVMSRLTTEGLVKMKMHAARPPPCTHRSRRGGPSVLPNVRKDISSQTDNDLICKYKECDKLEEPRRQITEPETQNVKFEEEKIQTRVTEENCFLNNDSVLLSARIRKVNIPKSVGFYIPHIQHKSDMVVSTPQSRQEQLCPPHLGSKYLLTINNKDYEARQTSYSSTLVDTLKDVYINSNMMYTRKQQDYLRVKVNLQPFRKVRVHPQQNTEAAKRGQSPRRLPPQSLRKKLRASNPSSSQVVTKEDKPSHVDLPTKVATVSKDCPSSKAKDALDKISKEKTGRCDEADDISSKAAVTLLKEGDDKLESLIVGTVEVSSPSVLEDQGSKTAFNFEESLKSEGKLSVEQSQNHSELKDLEIQGESEELTESKLQTQLESRDNAGTLCGNVLDPTQSNVTGISRGADSPSCGNNINCEIDITGSSLPGNKVNGHLEGYRKDDITEAGHLPRPDNSIKNTTINEATDREIKEAHDSSLADSKAGETGRLQGSEKEYVHLEGNKKVTDHVEHGKIFSAASLQSTPRRDDPPLSAVVDLQCSIHQQVQKTQTQDHKLEETNVPQRDVELEPNLPLKSSVKNEVPLIPRQNNEAPEGPAAHISALPLQNNANNNHSKASAESGRKRLSLSDSSKVIIVVESLNETINIQKYLSERSARHHTWQTTNHSSNENDSASGDGSHKKKICLILPEKSREEALKPSSKKIK